MSRLRNPRRARRFGRLLQEWRLLAFQPRQWKPARPARWVRWLRRQSAACAGGLRASLRNLALQWPAALAYYALLCVLWNAAVFPSGEDALATQVVGQAAPGLVLALTFFVLHRLSPQVDGRAVLLRAGLVALVFLLARLPFDESLPRALAYSPLAVAFVLLLGV